MKKLILLLLLPLSALGQPGQGGGPFPSGGGSSGGSATNAIGKTNGVGFGLTVVDSLTATNVNVSAGAIIAGANSRFVGNGTGITNISSDFYSNTFLSMETKNRTLNDYEGQPALNYGNPQAVFTYGTFEVSGDLNNSGFTHLGDAVNQHTFVTGRFFRQTNTFGGVGDPNRSYTLIDTNGNIFTTNAGIANSWLGFTNGVLSVGESAGNGTIQAPYFTLGTVIFLAETSPGNMEIVTTTCQADGAWNFPDGVSGDGSGLSSLGADRISSANMFSARLGTNSGSDGQVLSITGNKTKWVDQTGGSGSGTFNAAALTNWPNTTATNLSQRITSATTNKVVNGGYYTVNADDTLAWYVPVPSGATVVGPYGLVSQGGFFGDGKNLTNLNATQLLTGTIPAAQAGELSNHLHMAGTPLTAGDIYGWSGTEFTNGPPAAGTGSTPNAITNHYWPTPIGFSNTLSFEITNNLAPLIFSNANATINRGGVGSATRGAGVALYGFPAGIVTKLVEAYDSTVLITNVDTFIVRAGGSANYVRVDDGVLQVNGGNILLNNPGVYIGNGTSLTNMSLSKPKLATVLTDGSTINTDVSTNTYFRVTLGGNRTLANPVNAGGAQDGEKVIWEIIQDATGNRTITMDTKFTFGTDITGITLTTNASKRDFVSAIYNSTADLWYVVGFVRGY